MQHEFSIVPVLICNIKCNNEVFPACKEAFFINLQGLSVVKNGLRLETDHFIILSIERGLLCNLY